MPIIPTVFRPIRSNDFQRRPFKVYKNYRISNTDVANTGSGYIQREAFFHRGSKYNIGDFSSYDPALNSSDGSYPNIIWRSLDHRYYAHPYDPGRSAELTNRKITTKELHLSASTLSVPYFQVGERIKPGSVQGTFGAGSGNSVVTLKDDGYGNLRDSLIQTSSFASASRNFFHLSFNQEYRKIIGRFPIHNDELDEGAEITELDSEYKSDHVHIVAGIHASTLKGVTGVPFRAGSQFGNHGYAGRFDRDSYIEIPHDEKFDQFGSCDDWTISWWQQHYTAGSTSNVYPLISKYGTHKETYFDPIASMTKTRDTFIKVPNVTASFANRRMPFLIFMEDKYGSAAFNYSSSWHFKASNGTDQLHISTSFDDGLFPNIIANYTHITVQNSASMCRMFINGIESGTSGSIPAGITANLDNMRIGKFLSSSQEGHVNQQDDIAELRMYDYACSDTEIASLANNHYMSGSCLQTNIAGNVFYRSGEIVVSSPLRKYNSGSGIFGNTFDLSYKGTHTIYENEVLVRVPKDQFNVSMNPTANFRPTSKGEKGCNPHQRDMLTGEYRKHMFISGTAKPYITTIGLYNEHAQLLAIGKPSQAIQKRDDVDMNFIVRWDY